MKTLFATALVVLMMLVYTPNVYAAEPRVYLNPGFKLGYTFGEHGGFTGGLEVSVTTNFNDNSSAVLGGAVLGVDFCKDWTRLHVGIEASAIGVGCDIGPSLLFRNDSVSVGFSFIPFIGIIAYPFYNFSYFDNGFETHEVGSYFKLPVRVAGGPISW